MIHKKSWLVHSLMIATRASVAFGGMDIFQVSFEASKSNPDLNQYYIRTSEPYLTSILYAMIPLGAIMDFVVWRRPHLARLIIYFETLYLTT